MADQPIEQATVRRLAKLAALSLNAEECVQMAVELSAIVKHVDALMEVDIEGVPPMSHVHPVRGSARADVPQPSLSREAALAASAKTQSGGFAVPSFVDEG